MNIRTLTASVAAAAGLLAVAVQATYIPPNASDMIGWFDASAITGVGNGNPVGTWSDLSVAVNNLTAAGAARPTYVTASGLPSGLPVVDFDNTDDVMSTSKNFLDANTIIVLVNINTPGGGIYENSGWPGQLALYDHPSNGFGRVRVHQGEDFFSYGLFYGSYHIVTATVAGDAAGAAIKCWVDGVLKKSTTASINGWNDTIKVGFSGYGGYLDGQIAEMLIWRSSALDATERASVESYLTAKWLTLQVPEPSTALLLALGGALVWRARRWGKRGMANG